MESSNQTANPSNQSSTNHAVESSNSSTVSTKPTIESVKPAAESSQSSASSHQSDQEDDTFSWLDVHPKGKLKYVFSGTNLSSLIPATSCLAEGGPAKGRLCKFPFKYRGKTYFSCAPFEG